MSQYEYPKIRNVDMFAVDLSGQPGVALRDPQLYAREIIALPRDALAIIQHFTGTNTIEDIRELTLKADKVKKRIMSVVVVLSFDEYKVTIGYDSKTEILNHQAGFAWKEEG